MLSVKFLNRGETKADLKCEGNEPSQSAKLIIDAIEVTRMSIQCITYTVGIRSMSDDLHGANGMRQRTLSSVT